MWCNVKHQSSLDSTCGRSQDTVLVDSIGQDRYHQTRDIEINDNSDFGEQLNWGFPGKDTTPFPLKSSLAEQKAKLQVRLL